MPDTPLTAKTALVNTGVQKTSIAHRLDLRQVVVYPVTGKSSAASMYRPEVFDAIVFAIVPNTNMVIEAAIYADQIVSSSSIGRASMAPEYTLNVYAMSVGPVVFFAPVAYSAPVAPADNLIVKFRGASPMVDFDGTDID